MRAAHRHAILVVEDYDDLRDGMVIQLEAEGYAACAAASGRAALALLAEGYRPCLILLDLWMPGMDGWQVHAAIKANPATASVPVVMLSGDTSVVVGEAEGLAGMLGKPVKAAVLAATIGAHARCA